jgi:tetratricopeptide (TPR) repeat protein
MQEVLSKAIAMHQAGQLGSAAELYDKALAAEPDNADALHLLGVLHHQQGDHARALEEIGRAVVLRPNVPVYHANLAEVYRAQKQFTRAIGCCRMALRLRPDLPEALCHLGLALQGLGQHAEAATQFCRAIEVQPDDPTPHNNLGIVLRELKKFDESLKHFRRAVELAPEFAPAQTNLGQALLDSGQAEEALPHCREAVRLQPDSAPMHHNLGNTLRVLGELVEARSSYLEAIRLDPNLAKSHAHVGLVLQQEGQLDDALVWLKQAVEMEPKDATFWENMADLYAEREESAEAIPCWQRALAIQPDRAYAHTGLGCALQDEGELAEAEAQYRAALALQPDMAIAKLHLGDLREEMGDLGQAEEAFREALRLQPAYVLPHARLATLLRGKLADADCAALEQRLADARLGDGPRTRLLFALAHVLDARGDYARAAECLEQANALSRELNRRKKREYDPADHEAFVDRLRAAFGRDFFARTCGVGLETRRPVFVFGLPRSGTTLIEQVLASHARIHGAGELRLARQSFEDIPAAVQREAPPLECLPQLDAAAVRQLARQHEERLTALAGGPAERVVDKMPDNYMYLGLLAVLFPRATFIHCRRDLRDVAVSCWMTDFRSITWSHDPAHLAARFCQYRRVMEHWRNVLPVALEPVDYEEAVADLEAVARRLVAACGLEWDPACLEFHRTQRPIRTASVVQVRQPLYAHAVARWKNYQRPLATLFASLPQDGRETPHVPRMEEDRLRPTSVGAG